MSYAAAESVAHAILRIVHMAILNFSQNTMHGEPPEWAAPGDKKRILM